jgi:hypothetical protein
VANTNELSDSASEHGRNLLSRGFTIDQAVRDCGDVCQSITGLAVETNTAISADDFRTLNQCLDDAIAGAVTAFAKGQETTRDGELCELWSLMNAASVAFEALQSGTVGVRGATSTVVRRSLAALRLHVDRQEVSRTTRKDAIAAAAGHPSGAPKAPPT